MKPLDAFFITFLYSCINNSSIIFHCKMITGVTISFSKSVEQNCRILITVIDNKGHRDYITLNIKFLFQFICIITKSDQNLFQFLSCIRNLQLQIIQPFFINVGNISNCLNSFFPLTKLFDPWERINMSVRCCTHCSVFRVFFKYSLKIRHVFINQIFYRNNDSLFGITKKIIITHPCVKKSIRKISELCQRQIFFVIKLIRYKTGPVNVDIGLLFQSFKNRSFIRFLCRCCRCTGNKRQLCFFFQRKGHIFHRGIRICFCFHVFFSVSTSGTAYHYNCRKPDCQ